MTSTPILKFGKDHWSLLAYVESCCVDGADGIGQLDRRRLRGHPERHPLLAHLTKWEPDWGTRLAGFFDYAERADPASAARAGVQLTDHDDWDCLDDLEAAGLVTIMTLANAAVQITESGVAMAASLRRHKVGGGSFSNFNPPSMDLAA